MKPEAIKHVAAIAEEACNAVIDAPADRDRREELFDILGVIAGDDFRTSEEADLAFRGLCSQASTWAQVVRDRIQLGANRSPEAASIGISFAARELRRVLASLKDRSGTGG